MLTHKQLVQKMLEDPETRAEYAKQAKEFELLDEMLRARSRAGLTQADVAIRMGTKAPAVARLESGGGSQGHSPSIATLRRYAEAVGCELEIRLQPRRAKSTKKSKSRA
jgi:transcriptional regulator with XRE-family HTH domain